MVFETARLFVRDLKSSDFEAFHEMQSDDEVMRYTTGRGFHEAENQRQLERCIACYSKPGNEFWVWAVARKSDQQFLGTCAIVPNQHGAEIGYRFLKKFFGKGYGQEVCDGLIKHGIHDRGLRAIVAYADVRNVASTKILDNSSLPFLEETRTKEGGIDRFYCWRSK